MKSGLLAEGYRAADGHTVLRAIGQLTDVSEHRLVTPKLLDRFG